MQLVTSEGFPHGVRCGDCRQLIPSGAPYVTTPDGVTSDAVFVETIRCVEC